MIAPAVLFAFVATSWALRPAARAVAIRGITMKLSEVLHEVMRLSTAVNDYWDAELPKRHPNYPFVNPGEDSGPPPPEKAELGALLEGLPEEMLYSLVMIRYIGISVFDPRDIPAAYAAATTRMGTRESAIQIMTHSYTLAEYLSYGVKKLTKLNIDIDAMLPEMIAATA